MTESHSFESQLAVLRHPTVILQGQFEAAWGADGDDRAQANIAKLQDVEAERDRPGGFRDFTVAQDLDSITTTADVMQKATRLIDTLPSMDPQEQFDALLLWRNMAQTGNLLRNTAEKSMRLTAAIRVLGLQDKTIPELSPEERRDVELEAQSRRADSPYFPYTPGPDNPDWQAIQAGVDRPLTLLPPMAHDASDASKHGEEFALYNEGLKANLVFMAAAELSAELVGRDLLTGKPVMGGYMAASLEQAQARSRQLPERMLGWLARGLLETDLPEHFMGGFARNYEAVERVSNIIAGDLGNEIAAEYIGTYRPFYEFLDGGPAHQDENAPVEAQKEARLEHREFVNTRLPEALRRFQGRILNEVIPAFREAAAPVHPTVEEMARRLVAHALSGGYGWNSGIYARLHRVQPNSLADSVPILHEIAAEQRFDTAARDETDTSE